MTDRIITIRKRAVQLSFGQAFDTVPKHRLFFRIWPDIAATDTLTQLMQHLRNEGQMPGRPVDPDRLHVTLHHLGNFVDQLPPTLVPTPKMAATTVRMPPFDVVFDRLIGTTRSLLLRPSDGLQALRSFRKALSTALIEAGLRRHMRPDFSPHVSLLYDFSDIPEQPINPIRWTAQEFALIESWLGEHRHSVLDRQQIHA